MTRRNPHHVVHLSAARYAPADKSHSTYEIWKNLQAGFEGYHILARSVKSPAKVKDGHLELHLIRSFFSRELEALFTQFMFIPIALRIKPDAVISQNPVLGGLAGVVISRLLGIPHLVELHSSELSTTEARGLKGQVLRAIARWVYPRADMIRVLTARMRSDVMNTFSNIEPARIAVLPPRVDLSVFEPKTDWQGSGKLRVIMVGSLTERKGQFRAIQTLSQSGLPLDLWLVGNGIDADKCRAEGEKLTGELEVRLLGHLPPREVANLMRKADVLLVNSLSEGTPRVIMEAMALGLPVITTDAGYCADIVEHQVTGFVIKRRGGEPELVRHLKEFVDNAPLRRRLGKAGMARAVKDFDSVTNYSRYRELISDMIALQAPKSFTR